MTNIRIGTSSFTGIYEEAAQEIGMRSDQMQVDALSVTTTRYFSVSQARHCNITGYLIIEPLAPASDLWMLPGPALSELGPLLALCARAIHEVLSPIRVYCLTFAEEKRTYHCHLFPRSSETTAEYLKVFPENASLIHGPLLFDWARERYREDSAGNADIVNAVARLRHWIGSHTV